MVTVELEMVTGAGEEMEVAAVGERERNHQDGYHGNELQHGLKVFFGSFHWPTLHSTTQVMPVLNELTKLTLTHILRHIDHTQLCS